MNEKQPRPLHSGTVPMSSLKKATPFANRWMQKLFLPTYRPTHQSHGFVRRTRTISKAFNRPFYGMVTNIDAICKLREILKELKVSIIPCLLHHRQWFSWPEEIQWECGGKISPLKADIEYRLQCNAITAYTRSWMNWPIWSMYCPHFLNYAFQSQGNLLMGDPSWISEVRETIRSIGKSASWSPIRNVFRSPKNGKTPLWCKASGVWSKVPNSIM